MPKQPRRPTLHRRTFSAGIQCVSLGSWPDPRLFHIKTPTKRRRSKETRHCFDSRRTVGLKATKVKTPEKNRFFVNLFRTCCGRVADLLPPARSDVADLLQAFDSLYSKFSTRTTYPRQIEEIEFEQKLCGMTIDSEPKVQAKGCILCELACVSVYDNVKCYARHSYFPSRRSSSLFDQCQIILLGVRGRNCEQLAYSRYRGVNPANT